jgi:signal recognition particle subunit SRP54
MGGRAGAHVYERGTEADPLEIASWALDEARAERRDVLIVDTAGRLHIDQELMSELSRIRTRTEPDDVLLVVDAMTGQDAVGVAESFAEAAEFDGVVMTKLDGDARGGAALSVKAVTGKPILFASTGEKIEDFDRFHPDRMAQRILGMGDVLSLIEKAESQVDERSAEELQEKMAKDQFTLEDFLTQMKQVRKMGPLSGIIGMLPGMGAMKQLKNADIDERELDRTEAIILSMTPAERRDPHLIKGSRRKRIANGSGTKVQHVNALVKQFDQMRVLMRSMANGKMPSPEQMMRMSGQMPKQKVRRR